MKLTFNIETPDPNLQMVTITIYGVDHFSYDHFYQRLITDAVSYPCIETRPEGIDWTKFEMSPNASFYFQFNNVTGVSAKSDYTDYSDPEPPEDYEAIKAAKSEIINSLTEDDFPF